MTGLEEPVGSGRRSRGTAGHEGASALPGDGEVEGAEARVPTQVAQEVGDARVQRG